MIHGIAFSALQACEFKKIRAALMPIPGHQELFKKEEEGPEEGEEKEENKSKQVEKRHEIEKAPSPPTEG